MYNWELNGWAQFVYNKNVVDEFVPQFAIISGEISGMLKTLTNSAQQDNIIRLLMMEAVKTSEIEGEMVSREDVMSSIRNKLGLSKKSIKDKRAENIALMMLAVRENYQAKLSEKLIKEWHQALFANSRYINAGKYRHGIEPMQIVSGSYGKEKIHFEAPPSDAVPAEMKQFVKWYNSFKTNGQMSQIIIKTAITHLYFESIHPFEDGNGRIGRALVEKCLSESLGRSVVISISTTIEKNRKQYYSELGKVQRTLEINSWLIYFAKLLIEAQQDAINVVEFSIRKTHFFDRYKSQLNTRQQKVLNKMFEAGIDGFKGGMTARKYVSITKASKSTASRDLQELVSLGIFHQQGEGRNVKYDANLI